MSIRIKQHQATLSNTEAKLKKSFAYKKSVSFVGISNNLT